MMHLTKNDVRPFIFITLIVTGLVLNSCDIRDNEAEPTKSFLKIYDHNQFQASYMPIDVKQTSDGGYLILGATRLTDADDYTGVYLMKVDEKGEFIKDQDLGENYIHPVGDLMKVDGNFYFFAMASANHQVFLFTVDNLGELAEPMAIGLSSPLYASLTPENKILLLAYNNGSKETVFAELNTSGQIQQNVSVNIGPGQDVEQPLNNSFKRTGKKLPFITGRMDNGTYYFNGYYNYTMSLVFTDFSDVRGVTQGYQKDAAISAITNLSGNTFALARFSFGDNYILPHEELDVTSTTKSVDLLGNRFPELVVDAPVTLKQVHIKDETITLYASNTKNGQIVLLAYSTAGSLLGTKYLGAGNSYEVAGFTTTEDNGLALVGSTYLAGRFSRISLFKLSEEELKELVK